MSKVLRKVTTTIVTMIIIMLVAIGLTTISSFIKPTGYEDTKLACEEIYPLTSSSGTYPGVGTAYGWPFHFNIDITFDAGSVRCPDDSNTVDSGGAIGTILPSDKFLIKNFLFDVLVYTVPATVLMLVLLKIKQPRRKE